MLEIQYKKLEGVILHLQQVQSAIAVAVAALTHQNCEIDLDIANVLRRSAADKLQDQIEALEHILQK